MTGRSRVLPAALAVVLAALLAPVARTGAFFTSTATAPDAQSGMSAYCAVPGTIRPNVYRLNQFPTITSALDSTNVRMLIVPVANASNSGYGTYDPLTARTLRVRLWTCGSSLATGTTVKVTSWRRSTADALPTSWRAAATGGTWAAQRLDPNAQWGLRVQRLHRWGSEAGNGHSVVGEDRTQFSWLVGSSRSRTDPGLDPACAAADCTLEMDANLDWSATYAPDTPTSQTYTNWVDYTAEKYYGTGDGSTWPTDVPTATPVVMSKYEGTAVPGFSGTTYPASTDARQVQWVAMEWWGATPPDSARIEVVLE